MQSIVHILSMREGFRPDKFGALSLSVRDFTLAGRYADRLHVFGLEDGPGFPGIHYHTIKPNYHWYETKNKSYAKACVKAMAGLNPGLVEVHNRPVIVRYLAKWIKTPIALHIQNDAQGMKGAKSSAERQSLLDLCAAVYCVSEYIKTRFLEGVARGHEKVHVVYNGLAIPESLPEKKPQIVFVGRITENKGVLPFAEALAQVLPKLSGWRGVVIGGRRFVPSSELSDYEQQVAAVMESIGPQAAFEGFKPHEYTLATFAESAIAVIPSLWDEPFGRTALEAMAHGCVVITTGRGGLKEIVGDAGIIPEPFTVDTLANAIMAVADDPVKRRELVRKGRERAEQLFDIKRAAKTLDDIRAEWVP